MKNIILFLIIFSFLISNGQQSKNMSLNSNLTYAGRELSDIWGYVDSSGNEYPFPQSFNRYEYNTNTDLVEPEDNSFETSETFLKSLDTSLMILKPF